MIFVLRPGLDFGTSAPVNCFEKVVLLTKINVTELDRSFRNGPATDLRRNETRKRPQPAAIMSSLYRAIAAERSIACAASTHACAAAGSANRSSTARQG
ncbi:MAG TPA: hypothetical protein VGF16_15965 [Bryobacteraceae bacterium]|jgi:hypothetical protein